MRTWNIAENPPEYYKHVLLLILIEYTLNGKQYKEKMITEGYYHSDNVYCDYFGDTVSNTSLENETENETVIGWMELPDKDILGGYDI